MARRKLTRSQAQQAARNKGFSPGTSSYDSFINTALYTGVEVSSSDYSSYDSSPSSSPDYGSSSSDYGGSSSSSDFGGGGGFD